MMKRYNSYKDSGVEWIGEIPSHWDLIKTYLISENLDGKRVPLNSEDRGDIQGEIPYWGSGGIVDYINKYIFDEELLLVGEDGSPFFDSYRDVSFYINEKVWVNNHIHILRSKKDRIDTKFLVNSFNTVDYKEYITGSTRDKLTQTDLNRIIHPVPPLSEQQQIVSFLDTKTSLIDSLIEKTIRKIELLKEKRTSLINEVVTKGLNPNVEMKDSGVEWIGEIPSHWGKGKLYQYSEMSNGSTPSRVKPEYWENGTIPWMSSGEINKKRIREIDGRITQEGFENSSTKILPVGTVMMGLNGQGKTKGTVGILEIETTCNQSLCGMIFNDDIYPMFSYYFLDSQYYHIRGLVGEGQREGISVSFLGRYPLVVPPLSEQHQIVSYLDEQTQLIDNTVSIEEKRIELLKEYRQSLISEVVTGKQKVVNDELIMSISYEHFWNKIKDYKGEKNLDVLLIKIYKKNLRDSMILVDSFVHRQITLNKDISLEEYIIKLLYYYEQRKRIYQEIMSEINSKKYDNKRYKTKIYLEQSKKYIDVIEDYLSFINDVENDKYTPNELIESLVSKLNRFIMGREDKNLIYEELKFDLVDSFGYDDGDSDILPTHFGFWSNEYQLGYIEIIKVKEHFERVYEHFDNLSELKSSLNSMKVNLKSPF